MNHPNIAILLAAYNGGRYLTEQVESILAQSYPDFTLHLFDDASSDNTPKLCQALAAKDPRIQSHRNPVNLGIIANISQALEQVKADIYLLADQDDIWEPHKLSHLLKLLKPKEIIMAFSDLALIDAQGQEIGPSFWASQGIDPDWGTQPEVLALRATVTGCAMAFKKRLLEIALPIPSQASMHDQWLAFFAAYLSQVTYSKQPLVRYRQHGGNLIGALEGPKAQREKRYQDFVGYSQFHKKKWSDFLAVKEQLQLYAQRLSEQGHEIPSYLQRDLDFYHALVERQWLKGLKLAMFGQHKTGHSFFRTWLTAFTFPLLYFFVLKRNSKA